MRSLIMFSMVCGLAAGSLNITSQAVPEIATTFLSPTVAEKWVVPDGQWTPYVEVPTPVAQPTWTPAWTPAPQPSWTPEPTLAPPPEENIGRSSKLWIVYAVVGCLLGLLVLVFIGFFIRALLRWKKTGERPSLLNFGGVLPQRDERYMMNQV